MKRKDINPISTCEKKKLKRIVQRLPYDSWGIILHFLGVKEFWVLMRSVKGLFEYIKYRNSYCTQNLVFRVIDFPKRGIELGYVKNIRIGEMCSKHYCNKICEKLRNSSPTNTLGRLMRVFKNLKEFVFNVSTKENVKMNIARSLKTPYTSLQTLDISSGSDSLINLYSDNLPKLKTLRLRNRNHLSVNISNFNIVFYTLEFYVYGNEELLPKLEVLDIGDYFITMNPVLLRIIARNLKALYLCRTDALYYTIGSEFENLEELHLYQIFAREADDEEDKKCIIVKDLMKLRSLEIEGDNSRGFGGGYRRIGVSIEYETINKNLENLTLKSMELNPEKLKLFSKLKYLDLNVFHKSGDNFLSRVFRDIFGASLNPAITFDFFPALLKTLCISSDRCSVHVKNLRNVTNCLITFSITGVHEIHLNFGELKPSVERLEFHNPCEENVDDSFFGLSGEMSRVHMQNQFFRWFSGEISGFKKLKFLRFIGCCFKILDIKNVSTLKNISLMKGSTYNNKKRIMNLENLENLEFLRIENNYVVNVRNCPKIRKLILRNVSNWPNGVEKKGIEVMVLNECGDKVFENGVLDGKIFLNLKYLEISQRCGRYVLLDDGKNKPTVRELIGLRFLRQLIIRSNFIENCGILKIKGLPDHCEVNLVYLKGTNRQFLVDKSMNKFEFVSLFESFSMVEGSKVLNSIYEE